MHRVIELFLAILLFLVFLPLMVVIAIMIKLDSKGPIIFCQRRIGFRKEEFIIYKFRTMVVGTPDLASDLIKQSDNRFTKIGKLLRRYSLDELPQLINVIKGEMSFVGPRPALYNQYELIEMRDREDVHRVRPGITGWAQINGRDSITDQEKVKLDKYYIENKSFFFDLKIILLTVVPVFIGNGLYSKQKKNLPN